jgi:hypothetical protein
MIRRILNYIKVIPDLIKASSATVASLEELVNFIAKMEKDAKTSEGKRIIQTLVSFVPVLKTLHGILSRVK